MPTLDEAEKHCRMANDAYKKGQMRTAISHLKKSTIFYEQSGKPPHLMGSNPDQIPPNFRPWQAQIDANEALILKILRSDCC